MMPGKKCRHLNREDVDIGGLGGQSGLSHLTIDLFLRHNHLHSTLIAVVNFDTTYAQPPANV
jgi:hypothetical protein